LKDLVTDIIHKYDPHSLTTIVTKHEAGAARAIYGAHLTHYIVFSYVLDSLENEEGIEGTLLN
jgi:hypothetical protein